MAVSVRVDGARQLRASLKRAGHDLGDLKAANAEVSRIVLADAKTRVPRRSGALAATLRGGSAATRATVSAGYARVPYAGPVHWGTPPGGRWGRGRTARGVRAQPFLTDAAKKTEPVWLLAYRRSVTRILAKVKGA